MSERRSRLQNDASAVIAACKTCGNFVEVSDCGSESLILLFKGTKEVKEYILNFGADYPEGTVVCCSSTAQGELQTRSEPLTVIFRDLCTQWCITNGLRVPEILLTSARVPEARVPEAMEISPPPDPLLETQTLETQVSVASSEYTEASEGEIDEDYDPYDAYDGDMCEEMLHPLLEAEIAKLQELYGENAIECRVHAGIDEMDVFLHIDLTNFLDEHTASAWGATLDEPLIVLLHIKSITKYLDFTAPQVDVFQASPSAKSEKRKGGMASQLRKIMQTFVSNQCKTLSNSTVEKQMPKPIKLEPPPPDVTPSTITPDDSKLAKLIEMGFSVSASQDALKSTNNDMEKACAMLLQQSVDHDSKSVQPQKTGTSTGERAVSPSPKIKQRKIEIPKWYHRQESKGAQPELDREDNPEADKEIPSLDNGFLTQCMKYALNRIRSLNEFCVICDERHVLETGLLKPCVCTRELCVFAFQTLGVMADAAEAIATDADVVDLLIAMANAAVNSSRANMIFDPYPSIVDPQNMNRLAIDPKAKDFDQVKDVMKEVVLSREDMVRGRAAKFKQGLDVRNKLAFPLMQWVIATCRAHIIMLPEQRLLKSMRTRYQFLLISSPPSKEAAFQQAREKHGSTFAFHGSSIENWHSIMRKGLINASGTKYQLHGAAYGSGIYLSPCSNVSFGYMGGHYSNPIKQKPPLPGGMKDSLAGKLNLRCLALCEVVTSKDLKKSGDIWVCPNGDNVCTRFFFVYDDSCGHSDNLDTRKGDFRKEIDHAIEHIRAFRKKK